MAIDYIPQFMLLFCIIVAVFKDCRTQKIPNLLTYPMMLFGLVFNTISYGWAGFWFSAAGLLCGICVFLIPYLMGGMGAGDAKLMGGVGAVLGFTGVIVAAVISILAGLVYAIVLLILNRDYAVSFLKRSLTTVKVYWFTRQLVLIPPSQKEKQPVLNYALPIALGTIGSMYIMIADVHLIQDFLNINLVF